MFQFHAHVATICCLRIKAKSPSNELTWKSTMNMALCIQWRCLKQTETIRSHNLECLRYLYWITGLHWSASSTNPIESSLIVLLDACNAHQKSLKLRILSFPVTHRWFESNFGPFNHALQKKLINNEIMKNNVLVNLSVQMVKKPGTKVGVGLNILVIVWSAFLNQSLELVDHDYTWSVQE